jgi:hypothetical protein
MRPVASSASGIRARNRAMRNQRLRRTAARHDSPGTLAGGVPPQLLTNRATLQRTLDGFMRYYNIERPHQGIASAVAGLGRRGAMISFTLWDGKVSTPV